jgi:hypothetical protein
MKKVVYTFLALIVVSSISFAQMKLQLPTEITGETSQSFFSHSLESNLQLELPANITPPANNELLKMWFIGIMADATFPLGDFGEGWSTGFSGHVMVGYMIARSILLNLSGGYITFTEKESIEGYDVSFSWIPIMIGLNYVFNPGKKFMPFIGLGVGLYLLRSSFSGTLFGQPFDETATDTEFGIVPRLGAFYLASASLLIALTAEYNLIFTEGSSTTALGVLLGFMFALK